MENFFSQCSFRLYFNSHKNFFDKWIKRIDNSCLSCCDCVFVFMFGMHGNRKKVLI